MSASRLRKRLRRSWTPFFSKFGGLLPSQIQSIPHVLDGRNVILSAATASGKTEALVAPLAERLCGAVPDDTSICIVYVAPTRALVNDIDKRCRVPLGEMGIAACVRTGERKELREDCPAPFVITTPESLDSLVSRRPDLFRSLQAVVLDELHLVDKMYRGDQLRVLLGRLATSASAPLQVCIASATIDDPSAMAHRYCNDPVIVHLDGSRVIKERYFHSIEALRDCLISEARTLRKVLVFANSRKEVEAAAARLRTALPYWPTMVHHGSIDKRIRESTEAALRHTSRWICVATTTLEVGIDIGNVDAVVLIGPPLSIASLLQRIGRANRRSSVVNVICLAVDDEQRLLFEEQFRRARAGLLDPVPYRPDLSVVVQQLFAMFARASGGLADDHIHARLSILASEAELHMILQHLQDGQYLRCKAATWYVSDAIMDLVARGMAFSNIPNRSTRFLVDETTGLPLGEVGEALDSVFGFAGRSWQVTGERDGTIYVAPTSLSGGIPEFHPHRDQGAFASFLPSELRNTTQR